MNTRTPWLDEDPPLMVGELEIEPAPDDGEGEAPTFLLLSELQARPELLQPPECVVSRLAYRGRSTLLAHATARLTRREPFLGAPTKGRHGRVAWCGLEEALGDAVRRFAVLDADPERVQLVTASPPDLLERLDALLTDWPADLVTVDSLTEYARVVSREAPKPGDASAWSAIVRPLIALARKHDAALVILHHVRKSDGVYRDSGEIAASVDCLLELRVPDPGLGDPAIRDITGRARWAVSPFSVALRDGRYELAEHVELSTDTRVLLHVEATPGISLTALRKLVRGRASKVDAAVNQFERKGAIEKRGTGLHSTTSEPRMGGL